MSLRIEEEGDVEGRIRRSNRSSKTHLRLHNISRRDRLKGQARHLAGDRRERERKGGGMEKVELFQLIKGFGNC